MVEATSHRGLDYKARKAGVAKPKKTRSVKKIITTTKRKGGGGGGGRARNPIRAMVHPRRTMQQQHQEEEEQQQQQQPQQRIQIRTTLNCHDVVLGRGNAVAKTAGNIHFRCVIWDTKSLYRNTENALKTRIGEQVVQFIGSLNPPGRVLEPVDPNNPAGGGGGGVGGTRTTEIDDDGDENSNNNKEGWFTLVPKAKAIEKACQALRELKTGQPPGYEAYLQQKKAKLLAHNSTGAAATTTTTSSSSELAVSVSVDADSSTSSSTARATSGDEPPTSDTTWETPSSSQCPPPSRRPSSHPLRPKKSAQGRRKTQRRFSRNGSTDCFDTAPTSSTTTSQVDDRCQPAFSRSNMTRKDSDMPKAVCSGNHSNNVVKADKSTVMTSSGRSLNTRKQMEDCVVVNAQDLLTSFPSTEQGHPSSSEDDLDELDQLFADLPPRLTAFSSGLYSNYSSSSTAKLVEEVLYSSLSTTITESGPPNVVLSRPPLLLSSSAFVNCGHFHKPRPTTMATTTGGNMHHFTAAVEEEPVLDKQPNEWMDYSEENNENIPPPPPLLQSHASISWIPDQVEPPSLRSSHSLSSHTNADVFECFHQHHHHHHQQQQQRQPSVVSEAVVPEIAGSRQRDISFVVPMGDNESYHPCHYSHFSSASRFRSSIF